MKLLWETLSKYWQLRFLAACAVIALVVYAVLLPDAGYDSHGASIMSVAAAPMVLLPRRVAMDVKVDPSPVVADLGGAVAASETTPMSDRTVWLSKNEAAVEELQLAVDSDRNAELPRDFSESIRALRSAANRGDRVAQFLLGHAYALGLGVPKDMTETGRLYSHAAEARGAQEPVAGFQPADYSQALAAYRRAAEHGDAAAQLYMGLAYDLGGDLPRIPMEAARWYRMAAAQGSSSAASNLGILYYNGDGLPKDNAEASAWFAEAASRGSVCAEYNLGLMYYYGDGVRQDYTEADYWLERAARQSSAPAQVLLSFMYATGQGVSGSTPKAYMWINLASAGKDQARVARDRMEKLISTSQIAEGQKLTHDWLMQRPRSMRGL